ncbi:hypothetical protein EG328_000369 [Venturia inaequalis]|nr:hypothetical protein EG328_000369 [Venturia inaequalis]
MAAFETAKENEHAAQAIWKPATTQGRAEDGHGGGLYMVFLLLVGVSWDFISGHQCKEQFHRGDSRVNERASERAEYTIQKSRVVLDVSFPSRRIEFSVDIPFEKNFFLHHQNRASLQFAAQPATMNRKTSITYASRSHAQGMNVISDICISLSEL